MSPVAKEKLGYTLLIFTALLALGAILTQGPIPQDITYHLFVDTREIWSVPNFWNVVTNVPFTIVGLLGLYKLRRPGKLKLLDENSLAYILLFFGTFLVGFGSGYYHLAPDNQTLVWDRLPMTIAFMALFSIIISEFVSVRSGRALLLPLILAGILSVVYWHFSEVRGEGDLRFYDLCRGLSKDIARIERASPSIGPGAISFSVGTQKLSGAPSVNGCEPNWFVAITCGAGLPSRIS